MTSRESDGYLMLFYSIAIITLSFSLTFLIVFLYVFFIAIRTRCDQIKTDQVVILGKELIRNQPDEDYRLRLDRALTISALRAKARIYRLGGITGESTISESKAGQRYLENNDMPAEHIYIEEVSRDTLENIKQLKLETLVRDRHITLITNRYHLARASTMAQGFGFVVERCAAEDSFVPAVVTMARLFTETFFLHWYLSGRYYAKLIGNRRMLSRIQ
jgi:uncharacterized SAM-binding protein YcdF (DUF218 family)